MDGQLSSRRDITAREEHALNRLRSLFEVSDEEDITKLIGELFLFTQEIKSFLKTSKQILGIKDNLSLTELLEVIMKRLKYS
jgi:hypothetical protein